MTESQPLEIKRIPGLTQVQAQERLDRFGANELRAKPRWSALKRLGEVLSEPTLLVLLLVLALYLIMGSRGEAGLLGVFVAIVISVTWVEEGRTAAAVEALGRVASPRALVARDGAWVRLSGAEVVPGDNLRLEEGDRVPADAVLTDAHDFRVDESLLTGESLPVFKDPAAKDEALRQVWAGTLIVQGQGTATVTATGLRTRSGSLGHSLAQAEPPPTPFQRSASQLVRALGWIAAFACVAVVLLNWSRGLDFTQSLLRGLTLAVATVPEELPVILAVFMALGARRLSKAGVLARRVPAVETLGAVTLLAVDKTGTLTRNQMTLVEALPAPACDEAALLAAAALASDPDPFDPMERQILARTGPVQGQLVHEYSLQGRPPRMGHVWDQGRFAMKGGVEGVLEHCAMDAGLREQALSQSRALASRGLRLLAVAEGTLTGPMTAELPSGLRYMGLLAFEDPLRDGVKEAIATARRAGIRVVMMTGDSAETARAIGEQLGLDAAKAVLGDELQRHPERLAEWARDTQIFARLDPSQKLGLIKAWADQGQVVGMTGDGVNDAPALAQAHVGIGMGQRGTDVAREAADLVLLDDSFGSLIEGVRLGRVTTARILRAALFVLAVHVPIVGVVLGCLLLGQPPLIEAAQVAFLELFIGPACSLIFERATVSQDMMAQGPRDPGAPLLTWRQAAPALVLGVLVTLLALGIYVQDLSEGAGEPVARAQAFFALLLSSLGLCWAFLSPAPFWRRERWDNPAFWAVSALVLGSLLGLLYLPWTAQLLRMAPLDPERWAVCFAVLGMTVLAAEVPKLFTHQDALKRA